ncbi:putative Jumonji family transcription factor [Taphrina deformans PYCC 5710]|uniref:Jumonji family transcription factor n=1 Tax=Taphrina deformans (strain PYCC 5710 / ATCC 11124 / CBS 356.35 / IMI 108563 / JCM 9778 / NBRC 8474) TaxID=1097556 RepID=R4X6A7_TAPDE|nr:putative Jumonji family transcription factor [Taphrina deformans PYCC 5710]|eukprot:CCG80525.1 putative Jumonji family transcription factor [Taphrina deformans PYCC 5710]
MFNGMGQQGPSKADLEQATLESRSTLQWGLGLSVALIVESSRRRSKDPAQLVVLMTASMEPTGIAIDKGDLGTTSGAIVPSNEILPDHYWGGSDGTIPVFKPSMDQFRSFPEFIKKIDHYGMKTGIVKVIPPQEWLDSLPDLDDKVKDIKVQSAIEQNFAGSGGAFRQMNLEKNRSYSLPAWRKICDSSEHQPPAKRGEARRVGGRKTQQTRRKIEPPVTPPPTTDSSASSPEPGESKTPGNSLEKPLRPKDRTKGHDINDFNYRIDDNDQYTPERCQELEKAYWKSLTFNNPMYGADLPGSLFDDDTKDWNVAHLDNILNRLGVVLPGVNSAYLYLGMWKATFSWHVEDMDLYSINYIHFGAPKQWYSVSQEDNQKFERVMKDIFPNDARHCNQFMRHKTFGASPARLAQHDLHVNKLVHYEKEFVITFPYGYHSGYNLGYNCAESVNFATEEWLEYGKVARKCECVTDAVSIDVNDIIRAVNGQGKGKMKGRTILTPPPSDDEASHSPERATYSDFDRLRRTNKKKRNKDAIIRKSESSGKEEVVGLNDMDKARKALKCALCKVTSGACFQCSSPKCVRAFHGTCAYDAGVLVQRIDVQESGLPSYHFLCKTHRPRRPAPELLEFDGNITQFASGLQIGSIAQAQFSSGHCFSGIVRENRPSERTLVIEVGNDCDMIEVDYQWVLAAPKRILPCMKTHILEQQQTSGSLSQDTSTNKTSQEPVTTHQPSLVPEPHSQQYASHQGGVLHDSTLQNVQHKIPPILNPVSTPATHGQFINPYSIAQGHAAQPVARPAFNQYQKTMPQLKVDAQPIYAAPLHSWSTVPPAVPTMSHNAAMAINTQLSGRPVLEYGRTGALPSDPIIKSTQPSATPV